jgi:hypothetical protein
MQGLLRFIPLWALLGTIHLVLSSSLAQEAGTNTIIEVPHRLDTHQETVDFTGKVTPSGGVALSADGKPVPLSADGSFRIHRIVDLGKSKIFLVARDSGGTVVAEAGVLVCRVAPVDDRLLKAAGAYHALVIGNNDYRHLTPLTTAIGDAESVATLLSEIYGFKITKVINATREDILNAFDAMRASLTEDDNLLVYYAGHGHLDIEADEGFWMPVDAEPNRSANWVSNNTITRQLRAIRAKHVMVVADSCYSGRLVRTAEAGLTTGEDRTKWLARMAAKTSRTALTSGGLEPVLDKGGKGHSVFAAAPLETLGANIGVLDGTSLFDQIKQPVVVNSDQTPQYSDIRKAGHGGGDFLFIPLRAAEPDLPTAPEEVVAAPSSPDASGQAMELSFWESIKDSSEAEDFEAYLEQYPEGTFARLARRRIDRISGADAVASFAGDWISEVLTNPFDANDHYRLHFSFTMAGERVLGTMIRVSERPGGYRVKRGIFDGAARDNQLEFLTKYEVMTFSGSANEKHSKQYYATLKDGVLEIVMQDDQGYPPETFSARRAAGTSADSPD